MQKNCKCEHHQSAWENFSLFIQISSYSYLLFSIVDALSFIVPNQLFLLFNALIEVITRNQLEVKLIITQS